MCRRHVTTLLLAHNKTLAVLRARIDNKAMRFTQSIIVLRVSRQARHRHTAGPCPLVRGEAGYKSVS